VDERGLGKVQASCYVAGEAEIGILIDGTGDHAWDCVCLGFVFAKDVWEGRCEGGGTLDGPEVDFANAGTSPVSKSRRRK